MKTTSTILGVALLLLLGAAVASAQTYGNGAGYVPSYPFGGGGFYAGWGYHSSTYEEGVLRGTADYLRGLGDYRYQASRARINEEEARRMYQANRLSGVQTYFEMRKLNREYRAAEQRPRLSQQELTELARQAKPERLAGHQYEPAFAKVYWPAVLDDPQFAEERQMVDLMFAQRTPTNSGVGSENYRVVHAAVQQLSEKLKENIHDLPTAEYLQAKKFLASLDYEAQHRAGLGGVASR